MAINKKLVNFKKKEDYTKQKEEGNILDTTIVFIDDAKEIVTHDTVFDCSTPDWNTLKNRPFGEIEEKETICDDDLTFNDVSNGYLFNGSVIYNLVEGEKYEVVVDGKSYVCSCQNYNYGNDKNEIMITNAERNEYDRYDNYPYCGDLTVYNSSDKISVIVKKEGELTKSVQIYHLTEGIKKIDPKYYNQGGFTYFESESNGYVYPRVQMLNSNSVAKGIFSVAEGNSTKANGYASHTEGNNTTANGYASHTEGNGTNASGYSSHAEGNYTKANGDYSHAEGSGTNALADYSHAEGGYTNANGNYSHAEGNNTTASGNTSHAEGNYTNAIGDYSHAEGYNTNASGYTSHAEGYSTSANGYTAHAEGYNSKAFGDYSHAEGNYTNAIGDYSHAEGYSTTTSGNTSHAEGYSTSANGNTSHAEGNHTKANGDYSHAEGSGTNALADYSHAEGNSTTASGVNSHSEGNRTNANGTASHAEGTNTNANGEYSHAEGDETTTNNLSEHASGKNNLSISGSSSFGDSSNTLFTVGNGNNSSNRHNALQIMQNGDIYISDTNAEGEYFEKPMIKLQDALNNGGGNSAIPNGVTSVTVNGEKKTGDVNLGNVVNSVTVNGEKKTGDVDLTIETPDWNANLIQPGFIKNKPSIKSGTGTGSIINGDLCTASGNYSHAEGYNTKVEGIYAHSEGMNTTASGAQSHAEGNSTIAQNTAEHASGFYNISIKETIGWGDWGESKNTLFTVGNGDYNNRHNALQIMMNGDIYIPDTNAEGEYYKKPMIKLQDIIKQLRDKGIID